MPATIDGRFSHGWQWTPDCHTVRLRRQIAFFAGFRLVTPHATPAALSGHRLRCRHCLPPPHDTPVFEIVRNIFGDNRAPAAATASSQYCCPGWLH